MVAVGGDPFDVAKEKVAETFHLGQPLPPQGLDPALALKILPCLFVVRHGLRAQVEPSAGVELPVAEQLRLPAVLAVTPKLARDQPAAFSQRPQGFAIEALKSILANTALSFQFEMERGQLQYVSNLELCHRRTGFEDYQEPSSNALQAFFMVAGLSVPIHFARAVMATASCAPSSSSASFIKA